MSPTDKYGTVGELSDGRTYVQFERHLHHSVEAVWAAITDPAQREVWFPHFDLDLKPGGSFSIWFGGECEGPAHVTGTVSEYEPPHLLQCGGMRYELTPEGNGCLLRFSDILFFDEGRSKEWVKGAVLGGWHVSMDRLEDALAGTLQESYEEPDYMGLGRL